MIIVKVFSLSISFPFSSMTFSFKMFSAGKLSGLKYPESSHSLYIFSSIFFQL